MQTTHLTGPLEQARGVIAREPSADEQYVFEFDDVRPRRVHMLGVREPLLVRWEIDGEEQASERLDPWVGTARHRCDRIIERGVRA